MKVSGEILNSMISWRRYLHENPELSYKEFRTSCWLQEQIRALGHFEIKLVGDVSFVATIKGQKNGKQNTLAFRADMDALPVNEETGLPFASRTGGVMHACGHDVHMAIVLGLAKLLSENITSFSSKVHLVFQSAEEIPPGGAREIVSSGVLDGTDAIFGFHIFPFIPVGHIGVSAGAMTASHDIIELEIYGRGGHGAIPELSKDPILIGSEIVTNAHHIVSRNVSPFDRAVVSFGQFNSGENFNIIPDTAYLKGNIRTSSLAVRAKVLDRFSRLVAGICHAYEVEYNLRLIKGYEPVINDGGITAIVHEVVKDALGSKYLISNPQKMVSEDFFAYTNRFPGCFMILGGGEECDGYAYMNHHPKFTIDEQAMFNGLTIYLELVRKFN